MSITKISAAMSDLDGAVTINESSADADFRVESNGKTHALFIDGGNNQVLLNTSTARSTSGVTASTQIHGTGYNDASLTLVGDMGANALTAPVLFFAKTRGSAGASTAVSSGDRLGAIFFNGADGTDIETVAASIDAVVDTTPGSDDMPGRLTFRTSADGSGDNAERMRIDSSGNVGIGISPSARLHVDGSEDYTGGIVISAGAQLHSWFLSGDLVNVHNVHSASASAAHTWQLSGTEVVRITPSGITFNGDTAAANALDDYEEGSFTMGLSGTSATLDNTTAYYTKIGRLVYFFWYSGASTFASSSGTAKLTGLPFAQDGLSTNYGLFQYLHGNAIDGNSRGGYIENNATTARFIDEGGFAGSTFIDGSAKYIMVQGVYQTDA